MRAVFVGVVLSVVVVPAIAQTPRFDVVSVKRNTSNEAASSVRPEPNGITAVNVCRSGWFV